MRMMQVLAGCSVLLENFCGEGNGSKLGIDSNQSDEAVKPSGATRGPRGRPR